MHTKKLPPIGGSVMNLTCAGRNARRGLSDSTCAMWSIFSSSRKAILPCRTVAGCRIGRKA